MTEPTRTCSNCRFWYRRSAKSDDEQNYPCLRLSDLGVSPRSRLPGVETRKIFLSPPSFGCEEFELKPTPKS
jgi:hypothetical protein